jgi:hypothetical protein
VNRCFGWKYRLHPQGKNNPARNRVLTRLVFNLEDRGDKFLPNVGPYMVYTTLYARRWQTFNILLISAMFYMWGLLQMLLSKPHLVFSLSR